MPRLLRFALLLIVACALALAGVRVAARSEVPFRAWFTHADGTACPMPCLLGVQPGITDFEHAITLLRSHPAARRLYLKTDTAYNTVTGMSSQRNILELQPDMAGKVLYLAVQIDRVPLGEVMGALGMPVRVRVLRSPFSTVFTLSYSRCALNFTWFMEEDSRLTPDQSTLTLSIIADRQRGGVRVEQSGLAPWLGFSRVRRYLDFVDHTRDGTLIDAAAACPGSD